MVRIKTSGSRKASDSRIIAAEALAPARSYRLLPDMGGDCVNADRDRCIAALDESTSRHGSIAGIDGDDLRPAGNYAALVGPTANSADAIKLITAAADHCTNLYRATFQRHFRWR